MNKTVEYNFPIGAVIYQTKVYLIALCVNFYNYFLFLLSAQSKVFCLGYLVRCLFFSNTDDYYTQNRNQGSSTHFGFQLAWNL